MIKLRYIFIAAVVIFFASCRKEKIPVQVTHNKVIYDVDDVNVSQVGASKPNIKSTIEFISISFSDIFGTPISQTELNDLSLVYLSFGDKVLVEDMIIRNFLASPDVQIPTQAEVDSDVAGFVTTCYSKFYNRKPNEFERWQISNIIENDDNMSAELIYYSFMTSSEYRYY